MTIKAILFALDGILIDSIPHHKKAFQLLFRRFGHVVSDRAMSRYIRWHPQDIYRKLGVRNRFGLEWDEFRELRREIYLSLIQGKNIAFRDRIAFLKRLRKKTKIALVTNLFCPMAKRSASPAVVTLFDKIVTFSDVKCPKPFLDLLLLAARRLRVKPSECVMVGDAVEDIRAAKAARMVSVAFYSKTAISSLSQLRKAKPTKIVRRVSKLNAFFKKVENVKARGD